MRTQQQQQQQHNLSRSCAVCQGNQLSGVFRFMVVLLLSLSLSSRNTIIRPSALAFVINYKNPSTTTVARRSISVSQLSPSLANRIRIYSSPAQPHQLYPSIIRTVHSMKSNIQPSSEDFTISSSTDPKIDVNLPQHAQSSTSNPQQQQTVSSAPNARIVSSSILQECGERLRNGDLVAFPTETVYGLGCNALNEEAILKVFQAKERPLTDPLISHVADPNMAYAMWQATSVTGGGVESSSSLEAKAIHALTQHFWPGPLTIVAKAAVDRVPSTLMAGTGYCACRSPNHPLALQLIEAANVPIAAPSANKFGHVSPTTAQHVWDDLLYEDVWIVNERQEGDGDDDDDDESATPNTASDAVSASCKIGVESSVVKIEMIEEGRGKITLLRQGAVSVADLELCLQTAGLLSDGRVFEFVSNTKKATDETVSNVAPGQTIRHYSPNVPSFMVSKKAAAVFLGKDAHSSIMARLSTAVVIDFGGTLQQWQPNCLAYRDLSVTGNSSEATQSVFRILRWAEQVNGATSILFPEIVEDGDSGDAVSDALTLALKDRLTRAASGVVLDTLLVVEES